MEMLLFCNGVELIIYSLDWWPAFFHKWGCSCWDGGI